MLPVGIPKPNREDHDEYKYYNRIIHLSKVRQYHISLLPNTKEQVSYITGGDRQLCREEKDDGHEPVPRDSNEIDRSTPSAKVPRSPLKLSVHHLAHDWYHIRDIESNCADVEHSADGSVARQAEEVDSNFEGRVDPYGCNGRL